jgi:hypothetical protein
LCGDYSSLAHVGEYKENESAENAVNIKNIIPVAVYIHLMNGVPNYVGFFPNYRRARGDRGEIPSFFSVHFAILSVN